MPEVVGRAPDEHAMRLGEGVVSVNDLDLGIRQGLSRGAVENEQLEDALRTKTRKVAWKESSTSWGSPSSDCSER
jgi:hypothetical protein